MYKAKQMLHCHSLHPIGYVHKDHHSQLPVALQHINSDTVSMLKFGALLSSSGLKESL